MDKLWKEVGRDTEAGKLLFNLYPPDNKINYPKLKQKSQDILLKEEEEKKRGGKAKKACPQRAKVSVPAPKQPRGRKFHMIDFVPRKKNEVVIKGEMQTDNKVLKPHPGRDRKQMIDDLQERFEFQGMKDGVIGIDPKIRK